MKKKDTGIKKEYLILGMIIVALVLYLVFKRGDSVQYELPDIESLEKGKITRIEVKGPKSSFVVALKDDKWRLEPKGYPADKTKIDRMAETISDLTLTALVSESGARERYGLEEGNRILVQAYRDQELLREFEIGKQADTYRHTFVKLEEDPRVYQAAQTFRNDFSSELDTLRDKGVMKFDKNEVTGIDITEGDRRLAFARQVEQPEIKPPPQAKEKDEEREKKEEKPAEAEEAAAAAKPEPVETWVTDGGREGDKDKLNAMLDQLSNLECSKYIYDKAKEDFQDPIYTVVVKGRKHYTLSLFPKGEEKEGGDYPAVSSENPYPFFLSSYQADQVKKKTEDLLKKN